MTKSLKKLIESRLDEEMTPEQKLEQTINFASGNSDFDDPISAEQIKESLRKSGLMAPEKSPS